MSPQRITLATLFLASAIAAEAGGACLAGEDFAAESRDLETRFTQTIKPFLSTYCLGCHSGEKAKGDLDLTRFSSAGAVALDLPRLELVVERVGDATMPPAKAKAHPGQGARDAVIAWAGKVRGLEARRNAGDPGRVMARRLSNAEYDNTIRDLTGFDLKPTREFPVDPANAAGFDNSGESLAMTPALAKKYLDAARTVSEHLVFKPAGLAFAPHPMIAETDRDKYCVNAIISFYQRQKTDYLDYFTAARRYRLRSALGRQGASLDDFARELGLSPRYLATVWDVLTGPSEVVGPIAALRTLWNDPQLAQDATEDSVHSQLRVMRDFVVALRAQLVAEVKNLTARGIDQGTQPFVLWKNRQIAANRRRYRGGSSKLKLGKLRLSPEALARLSGPGTIEANALREAGFARFCAIFPDAFYVSERARIYLDPKQDKGNTGRLLSAGFHSMTGYFRDDAPLAELMLDQAGRDELDRLWREFDFITGAPLRQYLSYLWYERAETRYLKDAEFDFVRAEDKDAASEAKMGRLARVYLAKARRIGAGPVAIQAVEDQFQIIGETIRNVERARTSAEPAHVRALADLAERAYRRPLAPDERRDLAAFYRSLRVDDGMSHEDAVRDTVVGILLSPRFCYRLDLPGEGAGAGKGVQPLGAYDLASRLSYFLWASMPDRELLECARTGGLRSPETLIAQTRRMLRDPRARGFVVEFAGNWLDFRRFEEHNSVDRTRFPEFNDELRRSMFEEPVRYILDIVEHDRSVDLLLAGRHTFINAALAKHYRIPMPASAPDGWARVEDATAFGRGGLPPMAVFLTKNSPGLRTSPVKRGYWVVKRLLGENIPPPPAKVPDLPDDETKLGALTLRETLVRHRADKACSVCHERFDAMGLALEGFGPVGEARTADLAGRPTDTRAAFPGGREGVGIAGLRAYLEAARRNDFVENLCRKLTAYALNRTLIPSDDELIALMRRRLDLGENRVGVLFETIVVSPQFLNKRLEAGVTE